MRVHTQDALFGQGLPDFCPTCKVQYRQRRSCRRRGVFAQANGKDITARIVRGKCYVTRDVRVQPAWCRLAHLWLVYFTEIGVWVQNIDTDQIIPAEYLTLVPSRVSGTLSRLCREVCHRFLLLLLLTLLLETASAILAQPDEYEKLGSYALIGLPDELYPTR